jgi:hypothetical protein
LVEQPTVKVIAKALTRIAVQVDFIFLLSIEPFRCVLELIDLIS